MSDGRQYDWTNPPAWLSPKKGLTRRQPSRAAMVRSFQRPPLAIGFSIVAKVIPGREEKFYEMPQITQARHLAARSLHAATLSWLNRKPGRHSPVKLLDKLLTDMSPVSIKLHPLEDSKAASPGTTLIIAVSTVELSGSG